MFTYVMSGLVKAIEPIRRLANSHKGWSRDRNARVREVNHVTVTLRDFANAEYSYEYHEFEGTPQDQVTMEAQLEGARAVFHEAERLLAFLEQARASISRIIGLPVHIQAEINTQFTAAIGRMRDIVAAMSFVAGTDDHLKLGFSAVPKIAEPPPATEDDVRDLFRDAS